MSRVPERKGDAFAGRHQRLGRASGERHRRVVLLEDEGSEGETAPGVLAQRLGAGSAPSP